MSKSALPPLRPYQTHFLDDWLASSHKKTAILWPAGAGAIGALCALVEHLDTKWRILVIADRQDIVQQFTYRQSHAGVTASAVDRYIYRQLESTANFDAPNWKGSQVYVVTSALASQSDVAESLKRQTWNLVIFVDTNSSTTTRLIDIFSTSSPRVVWKLRPGSDPSSSDLVDWSINHLTVDDLMSELGIHAGERPSMMVHIYESELTEPERSVAMLIEELVTATKGTSAERLATSLRSRWLSSPAALESGLRRLESDLRTQWPLWESPVEDAEGDLPLAATSVQEVNPSKALGVIKDCLSSLDGLHGDPKLANLLDHLRRRDPHQSVAIFVRFRDTGVYLNAALEDEKVPSILVHGAMPAAEINYRMSQFLQEPGQVLVMTTAMLIGTDLRTVRDFILYDAPASRAVMSQLLAKFHLFGRHQLSVTVITDRQTASKTVELLEQALQFAV